MQQQKQKGFAISPKLLVSYLYLLQGIVIGLPNSLTLTYEQLPNYQILGVFAAATLPYSFKFLLAPLIQKYTSYSYGRRKYWVVISTLLAGALMYYLTQFTDVEHQYSAALVLFAIQFFVAIQDISVDALALKELDSPQEMAYFQMFMMQIGFVVGGMIFLELVLPTSIVFNYLGYSEPFISVNTFIYILSFLLIVPTILAHFFFYQHVTQQQRAHEKQIKNQSLWTVIKRYKYFLIPRYRVCRQTIIFILYPHGAGYFSAAFQVQLVKNFGFEKSNLSILNNFSMFQTMLITYVLNKLLQSPQSTLSDSKSFIKQLARLHWLAQFIYILRFFVGIIAVLFISQISQNFLLSCFIIIVIRGLWSAQSFNDITLVSNHASVGLYGAMYATMFASVRNLGGNTSIQLELISKLGFQVATIIGLVMMLLWIIFLPKIGKWIRQGQVQHLQEKQQKKQI